jgi:serralysin
MASATYNEADYRNDYVDALASPWQWTRGDTVTYYLSGTGWDVAGGSTAFRSAAAAWSQYANITFKEVTSRSAADLVETTFSEPNSDLLAEHYFPNDDQLGGRFNIGRDDVFNTQGNKPGGEGYVTFLHELGHALGLEHPFNEEDPFAGVTPGDDTDTGDFGLNQGAWTVMGYTTGLDGWLANAITPIAFDIAALQAIYGANTGFATGNNRYLLAALNGFSCIWDAGGIDTISGAGTMNCTIDLRAATLESSDGGGGFLSYSGYWGGSGALTIAHGVVIENAIGGDETSNLIGNDAANRLDGGRSETAYFEGGKGRDTFVLHHGADQTLADYEIGSDRLDLTGLSIDRGELYGHLDVAAGILRYQTSISLLNDGGFDGQIRFQTDVDLAALASLPLAYHLNLDGDADLTGSAFNDEYTVTDGRAKLHGADGADTLSGDRGDDILEGDAGDDVLSGGAGDDRLFGGRGNDTLRIDASDHGVHGDYAEGGSGDDVLSGYAGTLIGGSGNDTYYAAGAGSDLVLIEAANGGVDTLVVSQSAVLPENFEEISGSARAAPIELTGNSADNRLYLSSDYWPVDGSRAFGLAGKDILNGWSGNDILDGGSGDDTMSGKGGNDTYIVDSAKDVVIEDLSGTPEFNNDTIEASISYATPFAVENLRLTGSAAIDATGNELANTLDGNGAANALAGLDGNDKLFGRGGNDVLSGGRGRDYLQGGRGDDVFMVDADDQISERAGEGRDFAVATASYTLAVYVEDLALAGDAVRGTGNAAANALTGSDRDNLLEGLAGDDVLDGRRGADRLVAGSGCDRLKGGSGADTFAFDDGDSSRKEVFADRITDFSQEDMIDLALIDAKAGGSDDRFSWGGMAAFTRHAGELRFYHSGGNTFVEGDTDGNGDRDFKIRLDGFHALTAADFVL